MESFWRCLCEDKALRQQKLQEGCLELLQACSRNHVKTGVVTRNARRSVDHFCREHGVRFDGVITREFSVLKPHPGPILHLLEKWRMDPGLVLTVGDYLYDIECGRAAGTKTCFFQNPGKPFYGENADFVVNSMAELERLVFPGAVSEGIAGNSTTGHMSSSAQRVQ